MFVLELSKPSGICLAATAGDELLGYLVCSRYDQVWHLMNVAVAPEQRRARRRQPADRRGCSRRPAASCRSRSRCGSPTARRSRCTSGFGFRSAGVRPRYYHDNGEDALIMWLD